MSFSDYKSVSQVQKEYEIKYDEINFIKKNRFELSNKFIEEFNFNLEKIDVFAS